MNAAKPSGVSVGENPSRFKCSVEAKKMVISFCPQKAAIPVLNRLRITSALILANICEFVVVILML